MKYIVNYLSGTDIWHITVDLTGTKLSHLYCIDRDGRKGAGGRNQKDHEKRSYSNSHPC